LPVLLAGNPVNYSKMGKLSSAEALAAAAYILGLKKLASEMMGKFKWGHTFLDLNVGLLEEYSNATDQDKIKEIEKEYFPSIY
jgi:pre-rRNA-processing protein TSR3